MLLPTIIMDNKPDDKEVATQGVNNFSRGRTVPKAPSRD